MNDNYQPNQTNSVAELIIAARTSCRKQTIHKVLQTAGFEGMTISAEKSQAVFDRVRALGGAVVLEEEVVAISLSGTDVTDDDLAMFNAFGPVEVLELSNTKITDAGLIHLKQLRCLDTLILVDTNVTEVGVAELQAALPNTKIATETTLNDSITPGPPPDLPSWYWVADATLEWGAAMAGVFAGTALAERLGVRITFGILWGLMAFGGLEGLIYLIFGRVFGACLLGGFAFACIAVASCWLLDCGSFVTISVAAVSAIAGIGVGRRMGQLKHAYEAWEKRVNEFCSEID